MVTAWGKESDPDGPRSLAPTLAAPPLGEPERAPLPLRGEGVELRVELLAERLEDLGPGVVGAVDAVAEAHEALLPLQRLAAPGLGVLGRADLVQLVHHQRWRAAVG